MASCGAPALPRHQPHPHVLAEPEPCGRFGRSGQRSLGTAAPRGDPRGCPGPRPRGLSRIGRAVPARSRGHKRSPAPFARSPPKSPAGPGAEPAPRGAPAASVGTKLHRRLSIFPFPWKPPGCSNPAVMGAEHPQHRASPHSPSPEPLPGWNPLPGHFSSTQRPASQTF